MHHLSCMCSLVCRQLNKLKKYRNLSIKKQSSSAGGSLEVTQLGRLYINNTLLYIQVVEIAIYML